MNREILLLATWTLACVCLPGMGSGDFFRNEGLRSRLAWAMARDGFTVVPRLDGEILATKPPLAYWMVALPARWWGDLPLPLARWPSVVAMAMMSAAVVASLWKHHGSPAAVEAGFIFPMAVGWLGQVPSAELDMVLTAFVAFSWIALAMGLDAPSLPRSAFWWAMAGLISGLGFWTKWTAPLFLHSAVLGLACWRRDPRILVGPGHLIAIAMETGAGLLWVAMASREIGFQALVDAVIHKEALPHLSPWHHRIGWQVSEWFLYPIQVAGMGMPALLGLFFFRINGVRQVARHWLLLEVVLAGSIVSLIFWDLVPGHRPRHALPSMAGLVMAGSWAAGLAMSQSQGIARIVRPLVCICWIGVLVAVQGERTRAATAESAPGQMATRLAETLPPGATVGVVRLRDDGLLLQLERKGFRIVRESSPTADAEFWLLARDETSGNEATVPGNWTDQQGADIVLIRR